MGLKTKMKINGIDQKNQDSLSQNGDHGSPDNSEIKGGLNE